LLQGLLLAIASSACALLLVLIVLINLR